MTLFDFEELTAYWIEHPPLHTVEDSQALRGEIPGGHVKNLFVKDKKGRLFLLVLVMALLAGWSVGALGGRLAWAELGQIAGGFTGALVGGLTWAVWSLRRRGDEIKGQNSASVPGPTQ